MTFVKRVTENRKAVAQESQDTDDQSEYSKRSSFHQEWEEFKKTQELDESKNELIGRIDTIQDILEQWLEQMKLMDVVEDELVKRKELMDEQIDFLADKVEDIECEESLLSIEKAIEETEQEGRSLSKAYKLKYDEAKEAERVKEEYRRQKVKELSDQLIDKKIETQSFNNLTALEENVKNLDDAQLSAEIAELVLDASDTALKKVLKILIQDRKNSLDPDLIDQDVLNES